MRNPLVVGTFFCLAFIQIITPLSMIARRESVLKNGEQFKFKTAPVDPYDAFRGRYVALQIEGADVPVSGEIRLTAGQRVYALIGTDEEGYATFSAIATRRPAAGPYIQAKVGYSIRKVGDGKVRLDLPMDRYYMEEQAAPEAERIYRQHSQRGKQDAYLLVRVQDGFPVIEALYVGGQRIEDALRDAEKR